MYSAQFQEAWELYLRKIGKNYLTTELGCVS